MSSKSKFLKIINYLILFITMLSLFTLNVNAANVCPSNVSSNAKHVLFISSYSPSFQSFFPQVEGIKSQFNGQDIILDIEFMDTKRFYTDENINNFYNRLKYKIENLPTYDGIIVADDDALNFAAKYQNELFKNIPIVFLGANNIAAAIENSKNPYITGVVEVPSYLDTIKMALNLNKKAKGVVAIVDGTTTGQAELQVLDNDMSQLKNIDLTVLNLADLSFKEMLQSVCKIKDDKIILLLSTYKDRTGQVFTIDESVDAILAKATQPLYYPYYEALYKDLLGGKVISHYEQARVASEIMLDVLNGKDISTISCLIESPNQYVVNYNVLKKFGLDENQLPKGTILLNKNASFFEQYKKYVVAIGLISFMLILIIIILQIKNIRIRRAETELIQNKDDLMIANDELTVINEELVVALKEIQTQNEKIHDLIYKDELTGINNRFSIFQLIDETLKIEVTDSLIAIMFLDIDNFKNINDSCGHDVGDEVIKITAERLKKFESADIALGRFGGDEFIFLLKNIKNKDNIISIVSDIQNSFTENIKVGLNRFSLAVSIGISIVYKDNNSRTELLKRADFALYEAKNSGKNKFVFYSNVMEKNIEGKMILQSAIKEATKNNEFYLKYQPSVDTITHEILGYEALLRWSNNDFNNVSVYELIRNIEEMGLINKVGLWVLKEACQFTKKINANRKRPLKVSVNISAIQLMCDDFFDSVMKIINESGLSPRLIYLEMTETILIESLETGKNVIQKLKEAGVGVALDDFGTGYSSLKYFKDLPVSLLKIDKSFIDNITESEYAQNLIRFMINIAHNRNLRVTAEGIEDINQLALLKDFGCDTIQGFLFSKPLNEEELINFIENGNAVHS